MPTMCQDFTWVILILTTAIEVPEPAVGDSHTRCTTLRNTHSPPASIAQNFPLARPDSKCFMHSNFFNTDSTRKEELLILCYRWGNQSIQKLSNLNKVIQVICNRVRNQIQKVQSIQPFKEDNVLCLQGCFQLCIHQQLTSKHHWLNMNTSLLSTHATCLLQDEERLCSP